MQQLCADQKLRLYQLDQLGWAYALCRFDSPATAEHVLVQVDGYEFEDGGCRLCCQEVTDDVLARMAAQPGFCAAHDGPADGYLLSEATALPLHYRPRGLRRLEALQARPELAFDRPDAERERVLRALQAGGAVSDAALRNVLATDSSEGEWSGGD